MVIVGQAPVPLDKERLLTDLFVILCFQACFAVMQVLLAGVPARFDRVVQAGDLLKTSQRAATWALTLSALEQNPPTLFSSTAASTNVRAPGFPLPDPCLSPPGQLCH